MVNHTFFCHMLKTAQSLPLFETRIQLMWWDFRIFFVQTFFCSSNKFTVKLSNFSSIQIMYRFTSIYVYSKYECIVSSDKWVASCDTHLCAASVHLELFFFYSMFILRRHINHSLKWDWFFKFKHNTKCKVNRIESEKFFEGKRFVDLTMLLYQHSQFHFIDLIWNKTIVRLFKRRQTFVIAYKQFSRCFAFYWALSRIQRFVNRKILSLSSTSIKLHWFHD